MLRNPGATACAVNGASSGSAAHTSCAITRGAFLYFFAPAMAPLHWNSHRSGRFDTVTLESAQSYPAFVKASFKTSSMIVISLFMLSFLSLCDGHGKCLSGLKYQLFFENADPLYLFSVPAAMRLCPHHAFCTPSNTARISSSAAVRLPCIMGSLPPPLAPSFISRSFSSEAICGPPIT